MTSVMLPVARVLPSHMIAETTNVAKRSRVLPSGIIIQDHTNGQKVPRVLPFHTMIEQGES